jgi:hypothetical protein
LIPIYAGRNLIPRYTKRHKDHGDMPKKIFIIYIVGVLIQTDVFVSSSGSSSSSSSSTDEFAMRVIKAPRDFQGNCKPLCAKLFVPEECGFVGRDGDDDSNKRRKLLASSSSRSSSSRSRKRTAKGGGSSSTSSASDKPSRGQTNSFQPPSNDFVETLRVNLKRWKRSDVKKKLCGLWTKDCVRNFWPVDMIEMNITRELTHPRHPFLRLFVGNKFPQEKFNMFFPDLRSLGTCAVVAVGANLLNLDRGKEIDAHDTVIRYNSPMKKFEKSVGKKTDILYWKIRGDEKEYGQEGQQASKFYMFKDETKFRMVAKKDELSNNVFKGKPILWASPRRNAVFESAYFLYKKENKQITRGAASGGYKLVGDILASGLCTRVDLYGFSAEGDGKYFNRGKTMSSVHLMGLEHFVYRVAQSEGMMCIYD